MQIMITRFVCHFTLNYKKKAQDANTLNFPTNIKLPRESFSRYIIPKSASTLDVPDHLKSKLIKTIKG